MPLTFPRARRLRRRSEFQRIYDQGVKIRGRFMTLFALPAANEPCRLGVTATRKIGDAVSRNRARRRVRELFRTSAVPPGFDLVVVVRRELLDAGWRELLDEFNALLRRQRRDSRGAGRT